MRGFSAVRRIVEGCRRQARGMLKREGFRAHDVAVDMILRGDTYVLKVEVDGISGRAFFETPMFKAADVEAGLVDEEVIEDDIDYCVRAVKKLASLAATGEE